MDMSGQMPYSSTDEFLSRIPLFEKCSPQEIHRLAIAMRKQSYNKGETILFQGIISNQLFIIESGMVGIFSRKEKVTRFIANLEKGAFFGEISLVKNCAATATVKAVVDGTEIFTLDYDVIKQIMEERPEVKQDLEEKIRDRNRHRLETFEAQKDKPAETPAPAVSTTY